MVAELGPDAPVPQMAEQLLEVPKIVSQDRIQQQTVERSEAKRADIAKAEKSLAALMASQAAGKSSCTQVVSDHETSVKVFKCFNQRRVETTDRRTHCSRKIQVLLYRHRQISKDST